MLTLRDVVILVIVVAFVVWFFSRLKRGGCGCGPKMLPAPEPARRALSCGPFACPGKARR